MLIRQVTRSRSVHVNAHTRARQKKTAPPRKLPSYGNPCVAPGDLRRAPPDAGGELLIVA
jgi:hypothetical protein